MGTYYQVRGIQSKVIPSFIKFFSIAFYKIILLAEDEFCFFLFNISIVLWMVVINSALSKQVYTLYVEELLCLHHLYSEGFELLQFSHKLFIIAYYNYSKSQKNRLSVSSIHYDSRYIEIYILLK